ncbi:MAG: D-glucuronyl C5-epimerase family protein [Gemmatirosa sp.]
MSAPVDRGTDALPTAKVEPIALRSLQRSELWDWGPGLYTVYPLPHDEQGLPYLLIDDVRVRQPVSISMIGILKLSNAEILKTPLVRDTVERWARTLIAEADTTPSTIHFPYKFPLKLHSFPQEQLTSPWYSALAQGEVLQLLVRLYVMTGKPEYRVWADKVFAPFLDVRPVSENPRSVAHIDRDGYYWADEYPNNGRPDLTLNGYMYAIRGVYEYWQLTKSPDAERVVRASMTTLKRYHQHFRAPGGGPSSYCLRHPETRDGEYHKQIVALFLDFQRMSGDPVFQKASDDFKSDYWQ